MMRWLVACITLAMPLAAQWTIEAPVTVSGFLGIARGTNEVPARFQRWNGTIGISSVVRESARGLFAGELSFWYARTSSDAKEFRYATGTIMVDARGRVYLPLRREQYSVFVFGGAGLMFPLNERVLESPASPVFEPNMPALHFPLGAGVQWRWDAALAGELRLTYVLTTTDNLNAPHDGAFDGLLVLTFGVVFRVGY